LASRPTNQKTLALESPSRLGSSVRLATPSRLWSPPSQTLIKRGKQKIDNQVDSELQAPNQSLQGKDNRFQDIRGLLEVANTAIEQQKFEIDVVKEELVKSEKPVEKLRGQNDEKESLDDELQSRNTVLPQSLKRLKYRVVTSGTSQD
jgi:septal ring factor EnvC (AmiA/AmiB activator)